MNVNIEKIEELFRTFADVFGLEKDIKNTDSMKPVTGISLEVFKSCIHQIQKMDANTERILCAAVMFRGKPRLGRRHADCYDTIQDIIELSKADTILGERSEIEGFLTSDNRFVDRKEAWKIAEKAGQIRFGYGASNKDIDSELISENLYSDDRKNEQGYELDKPIWTDNTCVINIELDFFIQKKKIKHGVDFLRKPEFHMTIIGTEVAESITRLCDESQKEKVREYINNLVFDIKFNNSEFFLKKEYDDHIRFSRIVLLDIKNKVKIEADISEILGFDFSFFPHITTHSNATVVEKKHRGIEISSADDVKKYTL